MELERYHELQTILQQWKSRLAENNRRQIEGAAYWTAKLRAIYENEGTDEEFTLWLDRWCRQAAIQFILRILFLRVLEDRGLLGAERIRSTDGQKMWSKLTRNLGAAGYVQWCCWDAAHLLPDLFRPTVYDLLLPEDEVVQRFLDAVWRRPNPNRPGWLRFDFRPEPEKGDKGFQTRFIGDLYQELDAEIRERYALLQTPHFISQFILEHTLLKCLKEKNFREVTLMDPTCGSGHFLVDAFWMFVTEYEKDTRKGRAQLSNAERTEIARAVGERHLFGCDINPYASTLTNFRLLLAICDYARPASLRELRSICLNVVTVDSLIPYERLIISGVKASTEIARTLGQPEAIERALPNLRGRYDVVVGNPPYITVKDKIKRDLYRQHYDSAYGKFGLSAPFTERFLQMAIEEGYVGLINSNAFARRQFGKKLIEEVLPKYELEAIIDLSGAYIPGHGTPTLIIFAKRTKSIDDEVLVLSNLKGEPDVPSEPARGRVWLSVVNGYKAGPVGGDKYVDVALLTKKQLSKHPWQFGGPASRFAESICSDRVILKEISSSIGITAFTLTDEVYRMPIDFARRRMISQKYLRRFIVGEQVRDWVIDGNTYALFPYNSDLSPFDIELNHAERNYLSQFKDILAGTYLFGGKTKVEAGLQWFEYGRLTTSKYQERFAIAHAFITTHNHFVLTEGNELFNRSAQIVKLIKPNEDEYLLTTGLLNTSLICLILKQLSFDKRAGKDPVRDTYYELSSTNVGLVPIAANHREHHSSEIRFQIISLVKDLISLAGQLLGMGMIKLFELRSEAYQLWNSNLEGYLPPHPLLLPVFSIATELVDAQDWATALQEDLRTRMIFLQEELDWLIYELYGVVKKAPIARDYLTPDEFKKVRLQLGQRPFEIAGKGYKGDWPKGYKPAAFPDYLKPLTDARIAIIEANKDIALLEDPLYKRRWIPPDYEKEFKQAAEWWLAEKLEFALESFGKPISLRRWIGLLAHDERINATLEVLTGSPMFDLEEELHKVIKANAVANRPEHYLKPAGLRKLDVQVAKFKRSDFSDSTAWKIRGKLNIPRERFITYTEFDATLRGLDAPDNGGPWFGWAGWDAAQRAEALVYLLEQAGRAGWELHFRQYGLRAALRDLLAKGDLDHLSEADRLEFEGIAGMCSIGLDTPCYCQAYRDGVVSGKPGLYGVNEEVLRVKVLTVVGKQEKVQDKKSKDDPNQMNLL